jgi:hypothetical protein
MTSWVLPDWACGECNAEELSVTVTCGCCGGSFSVPANEARHVVAHLRNGKHIPHKAGSSMKKSEIVIDMISGSCPIQGEGRIAGLPFYFRARGQRWSFSIRDLGEANYVWYRERAWGDLPYAAGWMEDNVALALIEQCGAAYLAGETDDIGRVITRKSGDHD